MPFPISVPPPTVIHDVDLFWPSTHLAYGTGAGVQLWSHRRDFLQDNFLSGATGAGANTMARDSRGQPCAIFTSNGAGATVWRSIVAYYMSPSLFSAGLPSNYKAPSWRRVWRVQFALRLTAVVPSIWTFFALIPDGAAATGSPANNLCFMGLRGDGAGSWQYAARTVGSAPAVQDTQALGIPVNAFTLWDMVILEATPATNAIFSLYANGVLLLSRTWGGALPVPVYTSDYADGSHFTIAMGAHDNGVAAVMQLGPVRCMAGHFTPDGAEV